MACLSAERTFYDPPEETWRCPLVGGFFGSRRWTLFFRARARMCAGESEDVPRYARFLWSAGGLEERVCSICGSQTGDGAYFESSPLQSYRGVPDTSSGLFEDGDVFLLLDSLFLSLSIDCRLLVERRSSSSTCSRTPLSGGRLFPFFRDARAS